MADTPNYVGYNQNDNANENQKIQARANIGAVEYNSFEFPNQLPPIPPWFTEQIPNILPGFSEMEVINYLARLLRNEQGARVNTDLILKQWIEDEVARAKAAEEMLGLRIDAEEAARKAADQQLQTNIDNEAAARIAGDNNLQTAINNEKDLREEADASLLQKINQEITDRTNGDNTLQTAINNEKSERQEDTETLTAEIDALPNKFVRYDAAQTLTEAQKTQARNNIGAGTGGGWTEGAVLYNQAQALTDDQKAQARANIGAGTGGGSADGAVLYNAEQSLTDEQQDVARSNISAAPLTKTLVGYSLPGHLTGTTQLREYNAAGAKDTVNNLVVLTTDLQGIYMGKFSLDTSDTEIKTGIANTDTNDGQAIASGNKFKIDGDTAYSYLTNSYPAVILPTLANNFVRYDVGQNLSQAQQNRCLQNLGLRYQNLNGVTYSSNNTAPVVFTGTGSTNSLTLRGINNTQMMHGSFTLNFGSWNSGVITDSAPSTLMSTLAMLAGAQPHNPYYAKLDMPSSVNFVVNDSSTHNCTIRYDRLYIYNISQVAPGGNDTAWYFVEGEVTLNDGLTYLPSGTFIIRNKLIPFTSDSYFDNVVTSTPDMTFYY